MRKLRRERGEQAAKLISLGSVINSIARKPGALPQGLAASAVHPRVVEQIVRMPLLMHLELRKVMLRGSAPVKLLTLEYGQRQCHGSWHAVIAAMPADRLVAKKLVLRVVHVVDIIAAVKESVPAVMATSTKTQGSAPMATSTKAQTSIAPKAMTAKSKAGVTTSLSTKTAQAPAACLEYHQDRLVLWDAIPSFSWTPFEADELILLIVITTKWMYHASHASNVWTRQQARIVRVAHFEVMVAASLVEETAFKDQLQQAFKGIKDTLLNVIVADEVELAR
ncbi:hypothetical protein GGF32_008492 [Allomyces javanicus]|nr:hypothetical protein GGF32_008492 [Allomyces javanicus]